MTTAKIRNGKIVSCEKNIAINELTRRNCRECSLCNYNRNCNNDSVAVSEFDSFFAADEADLNVYVLHSDN